MRKNCVTCKHDRLHNPFCDECYNTSDAPTKWEAAEHYEPGTNADRIRAMSDEELAESLSKTVVDAICYSHGTEKTLDKLPKEIWDDLVKEYLEWLKQPAE